VIYNTKKKDTITSCAHIVHPLIDFFFNIPVRANKNCNHTTNHYESLLIKNRSIKRREEKKESMRNTNKYPGEEIK
jgi:hypothetical protein